MFVFNMKINSKLVFKIVFVILFLLILLMCVISISKVFKQNNNKETDIRPTDLNAISSSNYTNVLKTVHQNLNNYVGMKIKVTGFVYRLYDFDESQFVIAREMIVSADRQGVVVGFLCNLNGAKEYKDGTWVEIEGTITKGNYHGEIPIVEIYKINETKVPSDEYVYPPSQTYVPTSATL